MKISEDTKFEILIPNGNQIYVSTGSSTHLLKHNSIVLDKFYRHVIKAFPNYFRRISFPTENIPVNKLHFRWKPNSPIDDRYHLYYVFNEITKAIKEDKKPDIPICFLERYEQIKRITESIKKEGMKNKLIVMEHEDEFLVLIGNQRLCSLRILEEKSVDCIVTNELNESLILEHYPNKPIGY